MFFQSHVPQDGHNFRTFRTVFLQARGEGVEVIWQVHRNIVNPRWQWCSGYCMSIPCRNFMCDKSRHWQASLKCWLRWQLIFQATDWLNICLHGQAKLTSLNNEFFKTIHNNNFDYRTCSLQIWCWIFIAKKTSRVLLAVVYWNWPANLL